MRAQLSQGLARIAALEGPGKQEIIAAAVHTCKAEPPIPQLISTVKEMIQVKQIAEPKIDVQDEIQEHHLRKENALKIWIGGIPDWRHEDDTFDGAITKIKESVPGID